MIVRCKVKTFFEKFFGRRTGSSTTLFHQNETDILAVPLTDCGLLGAQLLRPPLNMCHRHMFFTLRGFEHTDR